MPQSNGSSPSRTENLAHWAAQLTYDELPGPVVERTKDFFVDWLACALAGRSHPAVQAMLSFAKLTGPSSGRSELMDHTEGTSAPLAALVNGAASHVVEQDDLHNSSMLHPATVIFPAALAVAQDLGADGKDFITACVVGYDVACRTGEYLGRSHYEKYHTTATAGVVGVAAAVGRLLKLDADQMLSAMGTAGTQAAGLWQFLLDASHSKQVHTGKACFDGIFAAYTAQAGLLGAREILEGKRAMGAVLVPGETNDTAIDKELGVRYAVLGSSFKWHASCRHTHPSVDALLKLMDDNKVKFEDIQSVKCRTYQAAINVLSLSGKGDTVHQSKFSMGFVLAVAAKNGQAMITDFTEEALNDQSLRNFQDRVKMELDPEIDAPFPEKWQGIVEVITHSGQKFSQRVDVVKGDPDWTLTRGEIEQKAKALAEYAAVVNIHGLQNNIERIWKLEEEKGLQGFIVP